MPVQAPEPKVSFSAKLFKRLAGGDTPSQESGQKSNFLGKLGFMILGSNRVEAGDAGATPICESVRTRLNSDGFLDLSNADEEEKKEEVKET